MLAKDNCKKYKVCSFRLDIHDHTTAVLLSYDHYTACKDCLIFKLYKVKKIDDINDNFIYNKFADERWVKIYLIGN